MPATRRTPAAAQASGGDPGGADSDDEAPNLDEDQDTESADVVEATASARNHQVGSEFMLHRRLETGQNGVQRWVPCGATDVGHEPDSRVHRYDRMIGFKLEEREAAEVQASEVVADNQERRRNEAVKSKSHHKRVELQSLFERWCLARCGTSPYTKWLKEIEAAAAAAANASSEDDGGSAEAAQTASKFMTPPIILVSTWLDHMRKDPNDSSVREYDHKGGTLKCLASAVSATCIEFGSLQLTKAEGIKTKINGWLKKDGHQSPAFDMEKDLKLMFVAVWSITYYSTLKQIQLWTLLLISIVLMGRSSCVTKYCPLIQAVELPEAENYWDTDGFRRFIVIGLREWKWRTESNVCKWDGLKPADACLSVFGVHFSVHRTFTERVQFSSVHVQFTTFGRTRTVFMNTPVHRTFSSVQFT